MGEAFGPTLEEAGHRVALHVEARPPRRAMGDRDLLAQTRSNLLDAPPDHAPARASIALALRAAAREATLSVTDDGPGAPEGERVFRRLRGLKRSRTTEGSGLGLCTVAVALHDGPVRPQDAGPGLRDVMRLPTLAG